MPVASAWLTASAPALAEPPRSPAETLSAAVELREQLTLGIIEHQLDAGTELTGWRLNHSWYLGHRDGDGEDGLSLVWQGQRRQVSISTEEIRFTRRF